MAGLIIRPAAPPDRDAWLTSALRAWLDAYEALLPAEEVADAGAMHARAWERRSDQFRLAVLDGVVAGFYSLGAADSARDRNYLWHLYVDPRVQRRGVGRALHDAALAEIAQRGPRNAWLDVLRPNLKARAFYGRLGWREARTDTSDGYDLVIMERDIA